MSLTFIHEPEPWDVVVVGSGATGGWAALQLGAAGLSVLVLEAGADGPDAATEHVRADRMLRIADRLSGDRSVQSRIPSYWELDPDLFVVDSELPFETPPDRPFDWIRTRAVNGRLLSWGGIGVRMSDFEFAAADGDGFGETWPLRYGDLASHYDAIDRFLPVYGERDGLAQLPDGNYVGVQPMTDAERAFQQRIAQHYSDRQVIASRGVLARPSARPGGEPPPPSPVRAAVLEHGVSLRADAVVSQVTVGVDGRANGVVFVDRRSGRTHEIAARSVVLAASTLESTRILLNSRSDRHPNGLGNSSDMLGRHLMDHPAVFISGFFPGNRDEAWMDGTGGPKNIMVPRFHNLENSGDEAFLRGYGIFGGIGRHLPGRRNRPDCAPNEVPFTLVAYGEMLARPENRVTLSDTTRDRWGIPVLHIDCQFSDNELAMRDHMVGTLTEMISVGDGRVVGEPGLFAPGGFVHETGTARMGDTPASSVLDPWCRCWDAPNVAVVDGAAWPTSAWQNPTFTMMAVAGRASAQLARDLRP